MDIYEDMSALRTAQVRNFGRHEQTAPANPEESNKPPRIWLYRLAVVALLFFSFLLVILMIVLRASASIPTNPPCNLEQVLEHGWVYFNYSLYHLSKEWKPWDKARAACQHKSAELVIINSIEEQEFIQSLLTESSSAWVGLTTMYSKWHWVDGTPETGTSWTNDPPSCQCKKIFKSDTRLITDQCSNPHLWICEKLVYRR